MSCNPSCITRTTEAHDEDKKAVVATKVGIISFHLHDLEIIKNVACPVISVYVKSVVMNY